MSSDPEHIPDDIEITPEMVEAGATILMRDPFLNLGPTSAELLAEEVLRAAELVRRGKTAEVCPPDR